jgi:uncharacterized membrane protein YbaN (DUF454 family)
MTRRFADFSRPRPRPMTILDWMLVGLAALLAVAAFFVITLLLLLMAKPVHATWKPEYAAVDPAVRNWYETRELTPAAQQRFAFKSCCAHSDVVKTKFKVAKSSGVDEWWWLDGGTWKRIPDDVIHWDEHAPSGEPVMFAVGSEPTCFYPPDGGL